MRKKLRAEGGNIDSRQIEGRQEFKYRLVLPSQAILRPHLERTARVVTLLEGGRLL